MPRIAILLGLLFGVATNTAAAEAAMDERGIRPARDGNVAIGQELDAARKANTLAAYDLFIARHPRHPLARTAREERWRLERRLRHRR